MIEHPDDFMEQARLTLVTGLKFKQRMKDRGLTVAQSICPKCGNRLDAALVGRKGHFHMLCRTLNCLAMME